MPVSLITISKSYLKNSLINKASVFLDENNESIKNCINCVITILYAKLGTYTNSKQDLSNIYNLIKASHFNNLKYINLENIFNGENSLLIEESNSFLKFLCENEFDEVSELISKTYKIHKESSSTLFLMVLPIVIGSINDVIQLEDLGINGFSNLLKGQKKYSSYETIPKSLKDKLINDFNFPLFKNTIPLENNFEEGGSNLKTIAVIISSLLLIGFILYASNQVFNFFNIKENEEIITTENLLKNTIDDKEAFYTPTDKVLGKYIKGYEFLGCFTKRKLQNGKELIILPYGGEANLIDFIESKTASVNNEHWFLFRRIITSKGLNMINIEKSQNQINNIIDILKAYPNVHITIAGYSYSKKNPIKNFEISYDFAGKVTKEILKGNINKGRIKFEGHGNNFPLSTEVEQLERIAIRVTKK